MEAESIGWKFQQFRWAQDSLIAHARNVCVAKFMESDATDMMFLDSDIACGPGAFTRLMSHQEEVVGAVYRTKSEEVKYPVHALDEGATQDARGLLEVKNIPFGFVKISRSAIEKMHEAYADEWFTANNQEKSRCIALFNTEIKDHLFWGEDYYFCRKWRETGGRIYIDPDIRLAHINGDGKAFTGSFTEWITSQSA